MSDFFTAEVESEYIADCGCIERRMVIGMAVVTAHLESNGDGDCHIDMGEYEYEVTFDGCTSIDDVTKRVEQLISSFGVDKEK